MTAYIVKGYEERSLPEDIRIWDVCVFLKEENAVDYVDRLNQSLRAEAVTLTCNNTKHYNTSYYYESIRLID